MQTINHVKPLRMHRSATARRGPATAANNARQQHASRNTERAGCKIVRSGLFGPVSSPSKAVNGMPRRERGTVAPRAAAEVTTAATSADGAVYIKRSLQPGELVSYPGSSVVIMGDVPAGSKVVAGGDVVVLGKLLGEAETSASDAAVVALSMSPSSLTIAGVDAAGTALRSAAPLSASLPPPSPAAGAGAAAVSFSPAFGGMALGLPLAEPAEAGGGLGGAAKSFGVVAAVLGGLWLTLTPVTVLGGYLHASGAQGELLGSLVEAVVYGFVLLQGAKLLSSGSELLLEVLNPGIIGGVVLPVLGAVPDSLIIISSGLNVTREQAQQSLGVGIGTLAGSSILLMSLTWGGSVLLGRCDLDESGKAINKTLTRGLDATRTGVSTDADVRVGAAVMAATVLLYGFVQVPAFLGDTEDPLAALAGAVACGVAAIGYCMYQVLFPELQRRKIDAAQKKRLRTYAVRALAQRIDSSSGALGGLLDPSTGQLRPETAYAVFEEFDTDGSGTIDASELQALLLGLKLSLAGEAGARGGVDKATMDYWLKEFDVDADASISREEFYAALNRWVGEQLAGLPRKRVASLVSSGGPASALLAQLPAEDVAALQATAAAIDAESADEAEEDMEGEEGEPLSTTQILVQATLRMGAGIGLCAVFSDPLVEALGGVSETTGVSPFFVGFVLTPLASNASEVISSLQFAAGKRVKSISLTFSQIYGAVTMNNTLVLGLFLYVVYKQQLEWVYSSEVAIIVAGTLALGALGYSRQNFQTWWAYPIIAIYPASLLTVYLLDTYLGWQ